MAADEGGGADPAGGGLDWEMHWWLIADGMQDLLYAKCHTVAVPSTGLSPIMIVMSGDKLGFAIAKCVLCSPP